MKPNYSFAKKMARKVIKDYGLDTIPVDLNKVFVALKYKIVELNDPKDIDGMILKIKDQPIVVVINKAKPMTRQRFTLAHELGHIFLAHDQRDLYDAEEARDEEDAPLNSKPPKEREADIFASELLIPCDKLKLYKGDMKDLEKLANIFDVSKGAMAIAMDNYFRFGRP